MFVHSHQKVRIYIKLLKYLILKKISHRYVEFLGEHSGSLQPTCAPGYPNKPHPSRAIVYTLGLSDMRQILTSIGENGDEYGEHSGKRGGATYAAELGIIEEEIRIMGDWKDIRTARLYIDKNTPQRIKRNKAFLDFL